VESRSGAANIAQIAQKMLLVMKEVGYVQKDGKNDFHGYKYASEASLIAALRPAMIKHGLVLIPNVTSTRQDEHGNTHVLMEFTIMSDTGHSISFVGAGSGNDRNKNGVGDKGIYKAITGCVKYALMKTFLLETGDDPEVASDHDRSEKQADAQKVTAAAKPRLSLNEDQLLLLSVLRDFADNMKSDRELKELWGENLPKLEVIESIDPEAMESLRAHFRVVREKLKAKK
jgi:hypothetical protein